LFIFERVREFRERERERRREREETGSEREIEKYSLWKENVRARRIKR